MSNDMNRQEAELNEAALSGVSGGGSTKLGAARLEAKKLCSDCQRLGHGECEHTEDLVNYFLHDNTVGSPMRCPYY